MKVLDTLRSTMQFRRFELDANKRRLNKVASVEDLRRIARRRLPRGIFDYIDGGAEDERTLAHNSEAFARIEFRPRVLREVGDVDPSTTLLGRPLAVPAGAGADRLHPHRRPPGGARRRPGRRTGGSAVLAIDDGHPVDRGGRRASATGASGSRSTPSATAGW